MRAMFIAAALLAPGTAWAATGDISCIEAKLGPTTMQRIGDGVVAAAESSGDPASALDGDRDALLAARQACRVAGNWSPEAVQAATSYTQARATRLGAESAIRRDGLDAAKLADGYAALSVEDRKSLTARASRTAIGVITAAVPSGNARRHVLLYFAALAGIEFYPVEFAAT